MLDEGEATLRANWCTPEPLGHTSSADTHELTHIHIQHEMQEIDCHRDTDTLEERAACFDARRIEFVTRPPGACR